MNPASGAAHAAGRLVIVVAWGVAVLALGLGACSKRITTVDPSYVPEGRFSPDAQLVVWFETPTEMLVYQDANPPGASIDPACGFTTPGSGDQLTSQSLYWRRPQGTINGVIFDGTAATEYQVMRREGNGGFRQIQDFPATPLRRWPEAQYEEYTFVDPAPSGFSPATYVGRGIVGGAVTPQSTLTNLGVVPTPTANEQLANIRYTGVCNPCDSAFTMRWSSVQGAARYWMQVYRYTQPATPFEILDESAAGPISNRKTRDIFVGFVDAPDTAYKIGFPLPRVRVLLQRATDFAGPYFVRISAVDANGRLLGFTRGNFGRIPGEGEYTLFRMGAAVVAPNADRLGGGTIPPCSPEPPFP